MGIPSLHARVSRLEQILQMKIPPQSIPCFMAQSAAEETAFRERYHGKDCVIMVPRCGRKDCDSCTQIGSYSCRYPEGV